MNSGQLRYILVFQIKTVTGRDSFGAEIVTWPEAFREYGACQYAGSREFPANQKRQAETSVRFIIRYRSGIDPATYRIAHDGKIWNITNPLADERKVQLTIEGSEVT